MDFNDVTGKGYLVITGVQKRKTAAGHRIIHRCGILVEVHLFGVDVQVTVDIGECPNSSMARCGQRERTFTGAEDADQRLTGERKRICDCSVLVELHGNVTLNRSAERSAGKADGEHTNAVQLLVNVQFPGENTVPIAQGVIGVGQHMISVHVRINDELLGYRVNEDKLMGPYFLSKKFIPEGSVIDPTIFIRVFKNKVLMYLFDDAAKQKRPSLFAGCEEKSKNLYSKICEEFDSKGVFIFCSDISKQFIDVVTEEDGE